VAVRNEGTREKRIQTIHGELRLRRSVLKVKHEGEEERNGMKEAVPLDEYLGITELSFKMTKQMMDKAAFWGQNQLSFRMAEEILQKLYGTRMTDDHIREATYR
jgi:hypothetical protein